MPSKEEERREALIQAAKMAHVNPGMDYDEAALAADAAAAQLLDFMRVNGEFALGLLQAASYMLSGTRRDEYDILWEVNRLTDRAIRIAPRNPDIVRRSFTIFQRMIPDATCPRDIIITDTNWETLPPRELLD
jgi:hypothetical protein